MVQFQVFADVYDYIFPLNQTTLQFLKTHLPIGKILDVGCATGSYLSELQKVGFSGKGIDSDPKMIELAKLKTKIKGLNTKYQTLDMRQFRAKQEYDGIYSIGNTLVYADSNQEVSTILGHVYQALKPNGSFILQIINYDRILDQGLDHLPTIVYPGVEFERRYDYDGQKIQFWSIVTVFETKLNNVVSLLPIRYHELIDIMKAIGYQDIQAYDGFSQNPFQIEQSLQLVITCHK